MEGAGAGGSRNQGECKGGFNPLDEWNWPMLAYAGFSYVTADFSLAEYRIQLFAIPVR
jgi:hypothetical protein